MADAMPGPLPSLSAYRTLFAICAGAAVVAALIALVVPASSAPEVQTKQSASP